MAGCTALMGREFGHVGYFPDADVRGGLGEWTDVSW